MRDERRTRLRVHSARIAPVAPGKAGNTTPLRPAAAAGTADEGADDGPQALEVAIIDRDSGFLVVLGKRMDRLGWKRHHLPVKASFKALAAVGADALIVDLLALGGRRWQWLSRVCELRPDLRIIVCTGSSTPAERVCALGLGADDWLTKPCHPEELIARVEAVTRHRRRHEVRDLNPTSIGEVEIRPDLYQAFVHGRSLRLTRREYQLIQVLSRAGGEVLPREEIYEYLWGSEMLRNDRSVDVFVHKLRRKLERASPGWRYVHTHFGIGYRLAGELADDGSGRATPDHQIAEQPAAAPLAA